ncbi:Trk system potassium transporter TrkA [Porphyromonadaceae bacterium]
MKIIIAGSGEVGTHLAKLLSREDQDIVLIDTNEEKLSTLDADFNIMTKVGSPTSLNDLKDAGVKGADLFIAVTPDESRNITAAILAAKLGVTKTLARIENEEYLTRENRELFEKLGVNAFIYPELLAAVEIAGSLNRPWVRQWWELENGELYLIGIKVRSNARICDKPLYQLTQKEPYFHIVAIKRGSNTIIPRGTDSVLNNDIVYFTVLPDRVEHLRDLCGKVDTEVRNVLIMGGSRIAIKATQLMPSRTKVKLIEANREKSFKLVERMKNVTIINGDGRNLDLLREEGIKEADAFIALSDNSETNILACVTAKRFGVQKTVAEVEDIDYIDIAERLDIGTVINKKILAASKIYQFLLDTDVSNIKCLTFANAEVAELIAKKNSKITRAKIKDLDLPKDITLGGLVRDKKAIIVTGDTQIQEGDTVVVFFLGTAINKIEKYFN